MKLSDVKHLIDEYFDNVSGSELINQFEEVGFEFEEIDGSQDMYNAADDILVEKNNEFKNNTISIENINFDFPFEILAGENISENEQLGECIFPLAA